MSSVLDDESQIPNLETMGRNATKSHILSAGHLLKEVE